MDGEDFGSGKQRNVLGGMLIPCSVTPMTGFYRDGCCHTGVEDAGSHTVCAVMTDSFLTFSKISEMICQLRALNLDSRGLLQGITGVYVLHAGSRHAVLMLLLMSGLLQQIRPPCLFVRLSILQRTRLMLRIKDPNADKEPA
jgi:hypothetical protein